MKKTYFISFLLLMLITACNNNDVELVSLGETEVTNVFLPINIGTYWTYKVENGTTNNRDSLYVQKDTTINAIAYKKLKTKAVVPFGFFSNSFNRNSIRKENDKMLVTGKVSFDFLANFPINVGLTDFIFLKENAANGEQVDIESNSFQQTINNFPIKIDYTLKSIAQTTLNSFTTSKGKTYSNVKPMKIILNLKATTTTTVFGLPVTVVILNSQDVVTSTQYYAKNIGMVYNKTQINYQLETLPQGTTIPFPQSGNQQQEEFLDTYLIN